MPAPKGNKYALGNKGGQPTKYRPEYCEKIIEFFTVQPQQTVYKRTYFSDGRIKSEEPVILPEQLPTFQKFADSIGVTVSTLWEWEKNIEEFSKAYARAKQLQEHIWLVNGMSNLYNSQFAQFFGKNCLGYKDTQNIEVTGAEGGAIEVNHIASLTDADLQKVIDIMERGQIAGEVVDITPDD
jgi:hypothetical protein